MKRLFLVVACVALLGTVAQAQTAAKIIDTSYITYRGSGDPTLDPVYLFAKYMEDTVLAGGDVGTGSVFYVDSNVTNEGDGTSWATAKDTLDEAVALCTANRGDVIKVAQGHAETIGSAADDVDLDVAGIKVSGAGEGTLAPTFTWSGAGYDVAGAFAVGAANITIENIRFVAGVSDINGIDVEAAAHNATFVNCTWPKPTTNSWEFLQAIEVADGANGLRVIGCEYYNDEAGAAAEHFIDAGNGTAGPVGLQVVANIIKGDFTVSAIWSDEPCDEAFIASNTITNHTTGQHCIEFTDSGTGYIAYNVLATDTAGTTLDPGSMSCSENYVSTGVDTTGILVPASADTATVDAILVDTAAIEIDTTQLLLQTQVLLTKADVNVADGTVEDVYTVTGGPILVHFLGIVLTEAASNHSVTLAWTSDPTAGAGTDTPISTGLDIDSEAIGDWIYAEGDGTASVLAAVGTAVPIVNSTGWVCPAGGIDIDMQSANLETGIGTTYLVYTPLSSAVTVAAP